MDNKAFFDSLYKLNKLGADQEHRMWIFGKAERAVVKLNMSKILLDIGEKKISGGDYGRAITQIKETKEMLGALIEEFENDAK
jgi:hypothetical protein